MLRPGRDKPNPYFSYKATEESGAAERFIRRSRFFHREGRPTSQARLREGFGRRRANWKARPMTRHGKNEGREEDR